MTPSVTKHSFTALGLLCALSNVNIWYNCINNDFMFDLYMFYSPWSMYSPWHLTLFYARYMIP